ncbi:hypothetical protein LSTR_LSTR005350 [Laodelphax striatellus]|uniref:C2 domain-containing protein n=1 Tax=Laodelphax striatellus TaxID=195883 RepID=A0A482WV44_LAOST|nr:hypothetical protein LSTR_LSTR005350 [Laodelphax striatellus]
MRRDIENLVRRSVELHIENEVKDKICKSKAAEAVEKTVTTSGPLGQLVFKIRLYSCEDTQILVLSDSENKQVFSNDERPHLNTYLLLSELLGIQIQGGEESPLNILIDNPMYIETNSFEAVGGEEQTGGERGEGCVALCRPKTRAWPASIPYVKLQLRCPRSGTRSRPPCDCAKRATRVYDEDFTFYGNTPSQLQNTTLHFVVLSFDCYSRDDIIGEVFCSLGTIDVTQVDNQELILCRDIQARSLKIQSQGRGELLVSLCWQPAANRLTVVVLKARNLPKMDVTGLADPYVKMYLLCNGQRIAKKKTHVKKRTLNPVFNESFVFEIPAGADGLDQVHLEFMLLDWDRVTKNEVIGRLELGGAKSTGAALHHWQEVCNSPRRQIAEWHKLRE